MKNITRVFAMLIFVFSCVSVNALSIHKAEQPQHIASHLRNALTDVSLTQIHSENATPEYVHINLADAPDDGKDRMHHSSYHGKHVTALVFLGIAIIALIIAISFIKAAKDRTNAVEATAGAAASGAVFLGFGIPGTILLARYPHNRVPVKEKE